MPLVLANRVQETSTTTGTGTLTLDGAVLGYQTFATGIGSGNTCYYAITSGTGAWEVGIGTVGTGTLARTTLLSSSTGSLVSFTGTLNVYVTYPSEKSVNLDASNVMTGYSISGGSINGTTVGSTTAAAGSFTTLNSNGNTRLGGASGNQSLQVNNVVSAVNYLQAVGAVTGSSPVVSAEGTDSNVSVIITPKGTGGLSIGTAPTSVILQTNVASGNNEFRQSVAGSTRGQIISSNTLQYFVNVGSGNQLFFLSGATQVAISPTASAVNYLNLTGAATGAAPTISAQGSDANITLALNAKGTGGVILGGNGQQIFTAINASGSDFTNYYTTTGGLTYQAAGAASTNITFTFVTKGTGAFKIQTGGGLQTQVSDTVSAVNYLNFTGAATGAAPTISAQGSDADVSLVIAPKGTGVTRFTKPIYMQRTYGTGSLIGLGGNTAYSVGANASGFDNDTVIDSTKTSSYASYSTYLSTAAAGFTLFALRHYSAQLFQLGAGSAVTNQYGFFTDNSLIGATNNYGFFSGITAATGRFNFYANGTAANVFVGQTSLGGTVGAEALRAVNTASAVNYVQTVGSVTNGGVLTAAAPELSAQGSDTNINLKLTPKGTGVLQFGTYTATVLTPTGFITITDAGGTSRRLLVG